jgi:hypothetical protein
VPVRVWAEAREARRRRAAKTKGKRCETFEARWIECAENFLTSQLEMQVDTGSFDCASASLRETLAPLRMTGGWDCT